MTSSSKQSKDKEDNIEESTNVAGGLGLVMQCSVLNREVTGATSSDIACVVNNNDGSRFAGKIDGLKASVTASGRATAISATPKKATDATNFSVTVRVDGLKSTDAQSIEISGIFDDKPAVLAATLKGRFALICDEDVTYYVKEEAPATNLESFIAKG